MSNHSPLLTANPELTKSGLFFSLESELFNESLLSSDEYEALKRCLSQANSKAFGSDALHGHSKLSSSPYQFLYELDCTQINSVLDLSQDIGGVAHFLADQVSTLDSLKFDSGYAELSAIRCANKPNVNTICTKLASLSLPHKQYDLIVVGQLEQLEIEPTKLSEFLANLRKALSDRGVLLINAANRNSLAKLLNQGQEAVPFKDSYSASLFNNSSAPVTGLRRKMLRNLALEQGFESVDLYATFSKANNVSNLFSESYLTASVNALNHFYSLDFLDESRRSTYLLFQRFVHEKRDLVELASRYILVAGVKQSSLKTILNCDFAYFPAEESSLKAKLHTTRKKTANSVERRNVASEQADLSALELQLNLHHTPYFKGNLLSTKWLNTIHSGQYEAFHELIRQFDVWLQQQSETEGWLELAYAALPEHIMVNERSSDYQIINKIWSLKEPANKDFILFRALFYFAQRSKAAINGYANYLDARTIGAFIVKVADGLIDVRKLEEFAKLEEKLQGSTGGSFKAEFLDQTFSETASEISETPLSTPPYSDSDFKLDQYRAELAQMRERIEDLKGNRKDLKAMLKRAQKQIDLERHLQGNLYKSINHLENRLHAQHERNDELHRYLMMRPMSRVKRVSSRWLDKLRRRPAVEEPLPTPALDAEVAEKIPFHDLPEGKMIAMNTESYELWVKENTLSTEDIERAEAEIDAMPYKPVFSILVPIYNTDPEYLLPMIRSVQNQIYPHWQLCLVDDCSPKTYLKRILEQEAIEDERICIKLNDVNQGISVTTNDALSIATGDYIALLDHDDEITIDALFENAKLINAQPECELIYSDEDKLEMDGTRCDPYFKPDFAPDLLDTNNYICHFTVIKKSVIEKIGGFREGLDGSQDHDLILRATDAAQKVGHIPRILYHWRKIPGSTAVEYDSKGYAWEAGRKAIEDLRRRTEDNPLRVEFGSLKGSYRIIREIIGDPKVSIIVPFKDKPELLDACLTAILNKTSYQNFELIGVSNNSELQLTHERMAHFSQLDERIRFVEHNVRFNFSEVCNYGVSHATGEYLVLLNNDIEILSADWIECLLEHAQRDHIGAVGGKLLYPDGRIQHAGIVAGMVGAAGHPHKLFPESHVGFNGRLHMTCNVSAVTGAMLMVSKDKYDEVGGLNAEKFAVAYNDVDFCLKLLANGYLNVFTPHVRAVHHESVSRGYEDTDEKRARLQNEQEAFNQQWKDFLAKGDPFYNPNLSLKNERFSLNFKD
ncbi:MAG: glycosyltransferase [Acidiferrobacterales bacterium]|nr:glycosyltransferase [Acidiferrobacterales bacterium]